jgi:hypothetical protein
LSSDDRKLLGECLAYAAEHEDAEERFNVGAFQRMADDLDSGRWSQLTEKQSAWVRGVHEKLFDSPKYENLWSSGKVPRGSYGKTPTPEVLLRRPLKPPGGRA